MLELPPSRSMGWKERQENIPLIVHQDWMEWQLSGFLRLNLHPLNHHLCLHKKMIQLIAAKMSSAYKKTSLLASHQKKKQTTSHHSHYASQIHQINSTKLLKSFPHKRGSPLNGFWICKVEASDSKMENGSSEAVRSWNEDLLVQNLDSFYVQKHLDTSYTIVSPI